MEQQRLQKVNVLQLLEKFKSKKELHRFLSQDCKAFLPKISSTNVYFFKQILQGSKDYIKRSNVKVSSVPHIEGLTVHDILIFARENNEILRYLPDEADWLHLDRQWICDVVYTIDTERFQLMIDNALKLRNEKLEQNQNMTVAMRPEFLNALDQCISFSSKNTINLNYFKAEKGRAAFLIKDSSKRKRKREELEEVKNEEKLLKMDKQKFLKEAKDIKANNQVLQAEIQQLYRTQQTINSLIEAGILNENGDLNIQPQFEI